MPDALPSRRRFQFRLRTLLIVVTMLAAMCAVVMQVAKHRDRYIRERERLIQEREDLLNKPVRPATKP